jgi:hypothetical protein
MPIRLPRTVESIHDSIGCRSLLAILLVVVLVLVLVLGWALFIASWSHLFPSKSSG